MEDIIKEYVADRDEAILSMDLQKFKNFIMVWSKRGMIPECFTFADDKVIEIAIRKMILGLANPPEDKLEEAKAWLLARGYDLELFN